MLETLERLSGLLHDTIVNLNEISEIVDKDTPIRKKCVEMSEYLSSCSTLVDREFDKLSDGE